MFHDLYHRLTPWLKPVSATGANANGAHLIEIWENTALVVSIRCEPLGEHLIYIECCIIIGDALYFPIILVYNVV